MDNGYNWLKPMLPKLRTILMQFNVKGRLLVHKGFQIQLAHSLWFRIKTQQQQQNYDDISNFFSQIPTSV